MERVRCERRQQFPLQRTRHDTRRLPGGEAAINGRLWRAAGIRGRSGHHLRSVGVETGVRFPAADDSEATEADSDGPTLLLHTGQSVEFQTCAARTRPITTKEMIWSPNPSCVASVLIRLNPELRHVPDQAALLNFLRRPFTDESCCRIDETLPALADVYRALAGTRSSWEAVRLPSLTDTPTTAFMPVAGIDCRELPLAPPLLLQAQVELLQGDLRDHQDRLSRSSGRTMVEGGATGTTAAALALQAFSFHEAAFLTLAGLFDLRAFGSLIEFGLTPLGEECLWNRVRSTTMQHFTDGAVVQTLKATLAQVRSRGSRGLAASGRIADAVTPLELDVLAGRLLDTYFALSSHMQRDPTIQPLIGSARQLCRWMVLLSLVRLAGEPALVPESGLLKRLRLDASLPEAVMAERSGELPSDRGIYRTPSGGLTLGGSSLAHAITCCKRAVLPDVAARQLGEHFEEHVESYVAAHVPAGDYVVRGGFKPGGKDQRNSYDCDLILYEPRRQKIFFMQAKWKRESRTANLDDEMKIWRGQNSALTKGVEQLRVLRERLSERQVLDSVRNRLGDIRLTDRQIVENASFVVVHTLPYFSAYVHEGVAIYEWNLFRNCLLRGATQRIDGLGARPGIVTTVVHSQPLPLEEPERVLDHFAQAIGTDLAALPQLREMRTQVRYGFDVELVDAPWWQRWLRPSTMRVVRPYL